jgi:hypothetical protein
MTSLDPMRQALTVIGQRPESVLGSGTAHVVAHGLEVVEAHALPGLALRAERAGDRIVAELVVERAFAGGTPVHLCFGMFEPYGRQRIELTLTVREGASATVWSHCLFPEAREALHAMEGRIAIEAGASLTYQEAHYHGPSGGIRVEPRAAVTVGPGARYRADFSLVRGRVGELDIDYTVDVGADALAELTSKVYGYGSDTIRMCEVIRLNGARARGLVKTRIAARDDAVAEIRGSMFGNAAGARGHVDCTEIVRDRAVVAAVPEVRVTHPLAKVTHEAAIGSVDSRQLETLMARGLDPDAAVDLIIRGMLA